MEQTPDLMGEPIPTAIARKLHIPCKDKLYCEQVPFAGSTVRVATVLNVDFAHTNNSDTDYEVMTAYIMW
jgi:hypothetical protein